MQKFEKKGLKKKSENLSEWYTDVILKAELADYAPVKGCMVIRPYGYSLWEGIRKFLDMYIKERGVKNAYFPVFIPEKYLKMEKEHIEGFSPHLAVVTIAGGEKLKEKLVVRPTSETVMYQMYKEWYHTYRDLPVLINQWNNIVRWEKRTYLFLRTSEFLWQEGHCAHSTHKESIETVLWALSMYKRTYNELLAMYGIAGVKSESEKFAGAYKTYTFESLMPDGKALQACTSHDLGQNFAKAFDWTVLDQKGDKLHPWQNSWGYSTRSIGGLILSHGDDAGLVLPPRIAPVQVIIVPIPGSSEEVYAFAGRIREELSKMLFAGEAIRCEIDDIGDETAGYKFNKWELKGVPLRLEIGERELKKKILQVSGRDILQRTELELKIVPEYLKGIQNRMFEKHKKFTDDNTHTVDSYDSFKNIMRDKRGFIRALWCEDKECETKIKEETKATTRVLPLDTKPEKGKCIYCGKKASQRWYFAQSY